MNRPAMTRLKADIEAGKIDMVVCYKIDRLSRSIIDFAELQKFFEEHNVHFVSVTQDINTSNSSGRMLLNILITFAAFERDLIIDRVKTAIDGGKKRGKFCGGVPMMGYRSDPLTKKLQIDEEEAQTVRIIFEKYLALESLKQTVHEVNRLGLTSRAWTSASTGKLHEAKKWTTASIHRVLSNPIYAGYVRHYDSIYEGETRLAQPDEVWNFRSGDGIERLILLANLFRARHPETPGPFRITQRGETATLTRGGQPLATLPAAKRVSLVEKSVENCVTRLATLPAAKRVSLPAF